jgi:hypothetical protein
MKDLKENDWGKRAVMVVLGALEGEIGGETELEALHVGQS